MLNCGFGKKFPKFNHFAHGGEEYRVFGKLRAMPFEQQFDETPVHETKPRWTHNLMKCKDNKLT